MPHLAAAEMRGKTILATGGCGYVGSHVVHDLLAAGAEVLVLDDLSNATPVALERVARLAGRAADLVTGDVRDRALLDKTFSTRRIDAVIHFAGLKAVGESVTEPGRYYDVNVAGSATLFEAMRAAGCKRLVFSSSATVYGAPDDPKIVETAPYRPANPYGRTKRMVETMIEDICISDPEWDAISLRYFNPVGAHPSGEIGENPLQTPNNLFPFIAQVAIGQRAELHVFGGDYPTPDGTGVRDYIHVCDLAAGHLAALRATLAEPAGYEAINLGAGIGYSVLEVVAAWSVAVGAPVPYVIAPRRDGDVPIYFADPSLAATRLRWRASRDLAAMCEDHWRWQRRNPHGYA